MADQQKSDEEFFAERGFGMRIGFGEKPAVIVIDVINAFTDPDMMLGSNLDDEIAETNKVLDAAHERGAPVIFTARGRSNNPSASPISTCDLASKSCWTGSPHWRSIRLFSSPPIGTVS